MRGNHKNIQVSSLSLGMRTPHELKGSHLDLVGSCSTLKHGRQ